jgi:3-hydroxybutyryl-CoA dehydrogenase
MKQFSPKKIAVFGAGTMGQGIAQWFAAQNVQVEIYDVNFSQAEKALRSIEQNLIKLRQKDKITAEQFVSLQSLLKAKEFKPTSTDHDDLNTDLVIEAAFEDKNVKHQLFQNLDKKFPPHTIFASNTSSFSIHELSQSLSAARKKHFLGLHFFNPAPILKLVEIVSIQETLVNLPQQIKEWFMQKGKKPVLCQDSPGFIVNRVVRNFYGEALRIAQDQLSDKMELNEKEKIFLEIDQVMKTVGGFSMGPFELMDLIGIDINYAVTCSVWEALGKNPRFAPTPLQKLMVEKQLLGRKTKQGFYRYES